MRRGYFLKATAVGSSMMTTSGLVSLTQAAKVKMESEDLINPIIPLKFYPNLERDMLSY